MKYKFDVIKEFVSPMSLEVMKPNDSIELTDNEGDGEIVRYYQSLAKHGFVKEIVDEMWVPQRAETYYYIDGCADTLGETNWYNSQLDIERQVIGNIFQTERRANKAIEWLKAFKTLREDTKGFQPNWHAHQQAFFVQYDHGDDKDLDVDYDFDLQYGLIYFANEDDAWWSVENHRKEWLTFYGVEDGGED